MEVVILLCAMETELLRGTRARAVLMARMDRATCNRRRRRTFVVHGRAVWLLHMVPKAHAGAHDAHGAQYRAATHAPAACIGLTFMVAEAVGVTL